MALIRPARVQVVTPRWAARVVSPMRDVLSESERRAALAANPDSYLHVTDDVPGLPAGAQQLALRRLVDDGAFVDVGRPAVFVYLLREAGQEHVGVVAGVDLAGFADGRVLGHEGVQPERVAALVGHHERVRTRSELVALFHRADPVVDELVATVRRDPPLLGFTDVSGVEQRVWLAGRDEAAALARRLDAHRLYVADGHHRVAAALQHRAQEAVLCAVYPQDQIALHAFHRRVRGPIDVATLLAALQVGFDVRRGTGPAVAAGTLGLYAAGNWHTLTSRTPGRDRPAGVDGLVVTRLDRRVLRPLLGVHDGDPRLELLPELRGVEETLRDCDADGGVLFTLHAPRLDDVVSVAERREVMSAKTTYVKPKPRAGIFLHQDEAAPQVSVPSGRVVTPTTEGGRRVR